MNLHQYQMMQAMTAGEKFLQQGRDMVAKDNAIRLANARKNAEAVARQRRYNQAMASEQADRNLKERLAEMQINARQQERQESMHPFDQLPGEVVMQNGRRAKKVPVFNHASGARNAAFKIQYDPRT